MNRINKNERIGSIIKILTENPKKIYTLNQFVNIFECAKSTLSEDIDTIKNIFEKFSLGEIETIAGAAGGVLYKPTMTKEQIREFALELCDEINKTDRIIPGGYIYLNDLLYSPDIVYNMGRALANFFYDYSFDYVVTIETKGIPIALMTARILNKPLVVVRKEGKLTDGTAIHMNYLTSSKRIQTMSLAKRALKKNSKVIFVDDFMKAGGTAKGIVDLMKEFECEVVGVGVLMATKEPKEKLVQDYVNLLVLEKVDEDKKEIIVQSYL
ncbi:pur operon repressor [Defluviitalea phaphyphila]|uniref:pur operon repressor n=1 Tax=Defluviitalea phaphyphila TaxID=1473580 RepID=UPI0007317E8F|nr:pur operon repressor [Defluviitalea phaphyphila]